MAYDTKGLTDMKLAASERNRYAGEAPTQPAYSYGTTLRLENAELQKLAMKKLPKIGDEYEIRAIGKVCNVYESQSEGGREDRAVQIQITHMALK
jgi:hypothetical protein